MAQTKVYLLDTQIFLWWLEDNQHLKRTERKTLSDSDNIVYLSVVSLWEIAIKSSKGKLKLSKSLEWIIKNCNFDSLSIEIPHILELQKLPIIHSDPFDRILISQAKSENLTLITADTKIWKYNIKLIKVK